MKRNVITLSVIGLLMIIIGLGIWAIIAKQSPQNTGSQPNRSLEKFTISEVARHSSKNDCWTIISNDVYDLTKFINRHPGGDEILRACGTDATKLFSSRQSSDGQFIGSGTPHSQTAYEQLAQLKIGTLSAE